MGRSRPGTGAPGVAAIKIKNAALKHPGRVAGQKCDGLGEFAGGPDMTGAERFLKVSKMLGQNVAEHLADGGLG